MGKGPFLQVLRVNKDCDEREHLRHFRRSAQRGACTQGERVCQGLAPRQCPLLSQDQAPRSPDSALCLLMRLFPQALGYQWPACLPGEKAAALQPGLGVSSRASGPAQGSFDPPAWAGNGGPRVPSWMSTMRT